MLQHLWDPCHCILCCTCNLKACGKVIIILLLCAGTSSMAKSNRFAKEQAGSCDLLVIARWGWKRIKEKINEEVELIDLKKDDGLHKLIIYMDSQLKRVTWKINKHNAINFMMITGQKMNQLKNSSISLTQCTTNWSNAQLFSRLRSLPFHCSRSPTSMKKKVFLWCLAWIINRCTSKEKFEKI